MVNDVELPKVKPNVSQGRAPTAAGVRA